MQCALKVATSPKLHLNDFVLLLSSIVGSKHVGLNVSCDDIHVIEVYYENCAIDSLIVLGGKKKSVKIEV